MATRRNLYGLDGVNFFIAAVQTGFGAFVTVYLVNQHWPAQAIGFALTIGTLGSLLSQMPAGAFIDSLPDKSQAVRLGIIGIGGAALLLGLSSARPIVGLALILQGLASSLIGPGIASISLALVGRAAFSEQVGRNARFASIGNGLTAGVMGAAGSLFAPATIFLLAAALTVPALLSLRFVGTGHGQVPATTAGSDDAGAGKLTWRGVKDLFLDRRLLVFAVCIVLFFASSAALLPAVAGQVTKRRPEFATLIVAATILVPQVVVALIAPWIGRTAERAGRRPMLLLGWGSLPVQGLLYASWPGPYAVVIGQILNGMSSAVFGVMMTLVAADLTRGKGQFNLALGTLGVAISIGASVSTFLTGITAAMLGARAAYAGLMLAGLAGFLLLWLRMPETHIATTKAPEPASAK
jgi:MFS family permease